MIPDGDAKHRLLAVRSSGPRWLAFALAQADTELRMNSDTQPTIESEPSQPLHRFSLAELMLSTLILGVLLGVTRAAFPYDFVGFYMIVITVMAGLILMLAILGKVRLLPMLAILAVLGLIGGYLLQPVTSFRRHSCHDNLRQIAAAMASYNGEYENLPPPFIADANGKPMHSWRVLLLPYLGQQKLYDEYRFDEPWNGPNNKKLHERIVDVYCCPQDHQINPWNTAARQTSYVVIVGPGTAFPGGRKRVSMAEVANWDGASNTILVAEVHSSGIHWMKPRDLDFATMDFRINGKRGASIASKHASGAMVVMVDGSVQFLDDTMPPKEVKQLTTVRDRP